MNDVKPQNYAANIGKQIQTLQRIYCPRCLTNKGPFIVKQLLYAMKNYEDRMFCPNCDLIVLIKVL